MGQEFVPERAKNSRVSCRVAAAPWSGGKRKKERRYAARRSFLPPVRPGTVGRQHARNTAIGRNVILPALLAVHNCVSENSRHHEGSGPHPHRRSRAARPRAGSADRQDHQRGGGGGITPLRAGDGAPTCRSACSAGDGGSARTGPAGWPSRKRRSRPFTTTPPACRDDRAGGSDRSA